MRVLEHRTTGKQLKIVSEPEKDKPFYTIRNTETGRLEHISQSSVGGRNPIYEVKTLDRKYPRGRF